MLLCRIDPGLEYFEYEKIVFVDEARVGHLAFEIGEAFGDERRADARGSYFRQAERSELVGIATG